MPISLAEYYQAPKSLPSDVRWKKNGSDLTFITALNRGDVTEEGLFLRGTAKLYRAHEGVMLQLEAHTTGRRSGGQLERLCWRPIAGHTNPNRGPEDLRMLEIIGSHFHDFYLNYSEADNTMRKGNLSIARPIEPATNNFKEFVDFCRVRLNIVNLETLPQPPWEGDLFGDTT